MGILSSLIIWIPLVAVIAAVVIIRGRYKNGSWSGAFFFEEGQLVLNTGIPYAIPFENIDYVELHYSSWELEHKWSYGMWVKVFMKGGKTKRVFYKGYRTAKLALPSDMEAALIEKGIRCVMVDK